MLWMTKLCALYLESLSQICDSTPLVGRINGVPNFSLLSDGTSQLHSLRGGIKQVNNTFIHMPKAVSQSCRLTVQHIENKLLFNAASGGVVRFVHVGLYSEKLLEMTSNRRLADQDCMDSASVNQCKILIEGT